MRFDMQAFRQDVQGWIDQQGYGGYTRLRQASNTAHVTLYRFLYEPGKLSNIQAITRIALACGLRLDSYVRHTI